MPRHTATIFTLAALALVGLLGWLFLAPLFLAPGEERLGEAGPVGEAAVVEPDAAALQAAAAASTALVDKSVVGGRTQIAAAAGGAVAQHQLRGRLRFASGAPAAAIEVAVQRSTELGGHVVLPRGDSIEALAVATTAADGSFAMAVPGAVALWLRLRTESAYLRDSESLAIAPLTAARDLGELVVGRTASVSGLVRDPHGRPCAGVRVAVGDRTELGWAPFGLANEPTGDDGRFTKRGLRPGKYTLTTASPDYLPARLELELEDGQERTEVLVDLQPGKSISGVAVDDTGKPLPNIKVAASRTRNVAPGTEVQTSSGAEATTTDAAGRFVLGGLDAATADVSAWGTGYARAAQQNVAVGSADLVLRLPRQGSLRGKVIDAAGQPVAGSSLSLSSAAGVRPGMGAVFANRSSAKSAADGTFTVADVDPGQWIVEAEGEHRTARSAVVDVQPAQTVDGVQVVVDRGVTLVAKVSDPSGKPIAGARVSVHAPSAPPTSGMALRAVRRTVRLGGGNASAAAVADEEQGHATTDAEGMARIRGLAAGRTVVHAEHERYAPARSPAVELPAAGEQRIELTVQPGGFVAITAVDQHGSPVAEAPYRLVGPDDQRQSGTCDGKGVASVGPLSPGAWTLRLALPPRPMQLGDGLGFVAFGGDGQELPSTEQHVEVVAEQTASVTLVQPVLATVRGTISDSTGRVAGAKVRLEEAESTGPIANEGYSATTDASGVFEIKQVPAAGYVLRYGYADAIVSAEERVTVGAGEALVERDLVLRTGTVKLTVRDEAGEPIARAKVALSRAGDKGAPRPARRAARMIMMASVSTDSDQPQTTQITSGDPTASTDADGDVVLERVPVGNYVLSIEHPRHAKLRRPDLAVQDGAATELGTVTMAPGAELRGRLLDAAGKPVEFASVERADAQGSTESEPAMGGSFRMTGLSAGKYTLRARVLGVEPPKFGPPVEVELGKGERKTVDLRTD